ncbi:MAG: CBS domain-containing protein [Mycobacteriaceae bacterium]
MRCGPSCWPSCPGRAGQLFALLDPDDRAWLSQRLPEQGWRPLLESLAAPAQQATVGLMSFPVGCTGRVMSPHVIGLDVDESAGAAIEQVRQASPRTETVSMLPVLDAAGVVVGVVSLRRLVVGDPETPVDDVMRILSDVDGEDAILRFGSPPLRRSCSGSPWPWSGCCRRPGSRGGR